NEGALYLGLQAIEASATAGRRRCSQNAKPVAFPQRKNFDAWTILGEPDPRQCCVERSVLARPDHVRRSGAARAELLRQDRSSQDVFRGFRMSQSQLEFAASGCVLGLLQPVVFLRQVIFGRIELLLGSRQ